MKQFGCKRRMEWTVYQIYRPLHTYMEKASLLQAWSSSFLLLLWEHVEGMKYQLLFTAHVGIENCIKQICFLCLKSLCDLALTTAKVWWLNAEKSYIKEQCNCKIYKKQDIVWNSRIFQHPPVPPSSLPPNLLLLMFLFLFFKYLRECGATIYPGTHARNLGVFSWSLPGWLVCLLANFPDSGLVPL